MCKILELHVKGYKRTKLLECEEMIITPTKRELMILGSNGSGKSSLMNELTPLPPSKEDYKKDGFKKIKVFFEGHTYQINTTFDRGMKTSIMRDDGVELNQGGTTAVAKDVIKEIFGVTHQIHQLMIGQIRFTTMTTAQRKEWMMLLSNVNYEYALRVFGKLKERYNEAHYSVKSDRKRLVIETEKLLPEQDFLRLNGDAETLSKRISELQGLRNAAITKLSIESLENNNRVIQEDLTKALQYVTKQRKSIPKVHPYTSQEELDEGVQEYISKRASVETRLSIKTSEHNELDKKLAILQEAGTDSDEQRKAKETELLGNILSLENQFLLPIQIDDPATTLSFINNIENNVVELIAELRPDVERHYTEANLTELINKESIALTTLNEAKVTLVRMNTRYEHMKHQSGDNKVECPQCTHRFKPVVSEKQLNEASTFIEKQTALVNTYQTQYNEFHVDVERHQKYHYDMRNLRQLFNQQLLREIWFYISEKNIHLDAPNQILTQLNYFKHDCDLHLKIQNIKIELQRVRDLIEEVKLVEDRNIDAIKDQLNLCDHEVSNLTTQSRFYASKVEELKSLSQLTVNLMKVKEIILSKQSALEENMKNTIQFFYQKAVEDTIHQLQIQLATVSNALVEAKQQAAVVKDIEINVAKKEKEEIALKLLVSSLSPTEGLIAESMLGFIQGLTGQMNNIIKKIWTYSFKIKACGREGNDGVELDYKFPMVVKGQDPAIPDIALGSVGMKEIIDLTFKIVAMRCLNMQTHPMFLDEFAASFDMTHRTAAINIIKWMLDNQPYSQLWMISHYEETITAFKNAEICVLCPNNIVLPAVYNKHVQFIN